MEESTTPTDAVTTKSESDSISYGSPASIVNNVQVSS